MLGSASSAAIDPEIDETTRDEVVAAPSDNPEKTKQSPVNDEAVTSPEKLRDDEAEMLEIAGHKEKELSSSATLSMYVAENNLEKYASLYSKYNTQCSEIERIEKKNCELREQLQKMKRERDSAQELLKTCRSESTTRCEGLERRILDAELQLKMTIQRAQARELYHQQHIKQSNEKWDKKFAQLTKRAEAAEKEKNDAVCRYAAREAELMRLQAQLERLEEEKNILMVEKDALQKSTQFECLQNLKHSLAEVERQLAQEKQANKELEEQHKMTNKHLEANQTALTELRSRLESIQSQLAMEQIEKGNCKEELRKAQTMLKTMEQHCVEEVDAAKRQTNDQEELYRDVCSELTLLRSRNASLSQQLDHLVQTNAELQTECQQLSQELMHARQAHQADLEKLQSLEQIQTQVNSSLRRAELAESATAEAATERDQAEAEAAECRKQAERMLEITEQLTDKNSSLTSQQEILRIKNLELNQRVKSLESSVSTHEARNAELEQEFELLKIDSSAEIKTLRQQIDSNIAKEQQLNAMIDELRNEQEVLRKKNASSIKELRAEVQYLRKLQLRSSNSTPPNATVDDNLSLPMLSNGAVGPSTSSRASSIASSSDPGALAAASASATTHIAPGTTSQQKESQQSFLTLASPDETSHVQQQMIEKIVKLQRQLARRQDKIEFLEEHVRQCTQELLKKTKIIQNYALREEAALLLPESDLNKVPRRSGGASSFMGSLFASGTSGSDRKTDLEFATEVNSRLQAVLEDALHKNITLKNNIDTLGEEISRLSRENRQLALSKAT